MSRPQLFILSLLLPAVAAAAEPLPAPEEIQRLFHSGGPAAIRHLAPADPALLQKLAERGMRERNEELLSAALELARAGGEERLAAGLLQSRGQLRYLRGDAAAAVTDLEGALEAYRRLQDLPGVAGVLKRLGDARVLAGERERGLELYREAEPLFVRLEDHLGSGNLLRSLGDLRRDLGDAAGARAAYRSALEEYGIAGSPLGSGNALRGLGSLEQSAGNHGKALELYLEAAARFAEAGSLRGEHGARLAAGEAQLAAGDSSGALSSFRTALALAERRGDAGERGEALRHIGRALSASGDAAGAAEALRGAVEASSSAADHMGVGEASVALAELPGQRDRAAWLRRGIEAFAAAGAAVPEGNLRLRLGELLASTDRTQALAELELAAAAYRRGGEKRGEALALRRSADLLAQRDAAGALSRHLSAARLYREAGDAAGEALATRSAAELQAVLGEKENAERGFRRADALFASAGDAGGAAESLRALGELFFRSGDHARGEEIFAAALARQREGGAKGAGELYRSWGDLLLAAGDTARAAEMYEAAGRSPDLAADHDAQSRLLRSRGDLHFFTGNQGKALEMYHAALSAAEQGGSHLGQANALRSLADLHASSGEPSRARELLGKARPLYERIGSPLGLAGVERGLGDIMIRSGEDAEGEAAYLRALELFTAADVPAGAAMTYRSLGEIRLRRGDAAGAAEMFGHGRAVAERVASPVVLGNLYQGSGDLAAVRGNLPEAREMYTRALAEFGKAGETAAEGFCRFRLAGVLRRQGEHREALRLSEEAVQRLETVRRQASYEHLRKGFMQGVRQVYLDAASFMLEGGFERNAFRMVEGMKARLFLDRLAEGAVDLDAGLDADLKARRDALGRRSAVHLRQTAWEADNPASRRDPAESAREGAGIAAETEALEREIRRRNPLYGSVNYPEPVTAAELQQLLKEDEVLVEYALLPGGVYAFTVTRGTFSSRRLPVSAAELEGKVRSYLARSSERRRVEVEGGELYDLLLGPLPAELEGKKLVLVPDGILALLPFETLLERIPSGRRFLLEKAGVRYVQSASVLKTLRTLRRPAASGGFFGVGDPVYDFDGFGRGNETRRTVAGEVLERLEGSGLEVQEIADIFRSRNMEALSLLRLDAREENLKRDLSRYRYLHLATHGILGSGSQAVVLSLLPGAQEDG
ncbi:MAG TPA: tetratricopeptide repeat protein, partial [Verrucomicrobiae bacterium]|nr:tetratricopeptide repeat protein [Verrucomicrobiae bacterium]